jgi:GPH family glycoside/pentoside/hexuronide:cation symporter
MSGNTSSTPALGAGTPIAAQGRLARWQLLLFAFPSAPHAFVVMPMLVVLPSFYAANTAVTLAQIAAIATLSRILDALADPIVGFLSDLTRSRLGPRKPWMLAVALICPVAIFFLFQPPKDATVLYFSAWSFALYIGIAMFEIPRSAWAAELTRDYAERSRVSIFVAVSNVTGSLVFWVLPLALWKFTGTTAITGTAITAIAWLYAILMPVSLLLGVALVPTGIPQIQAAGQSAWRAVVKSVRSCRPLWNYLLMITFWGLGQGAFLSMTYIFFTDYMKLGDKFPIMMIAFFVVQLAAMPVWSRLLKRVDRHRAWAWSLAIDSLARLAVLALPIGPEAFYPGLLIVLVTAFFNAPANFLPPAILGDVVDYNTLKTGTNKAANFFALNNLLIKVTMALGSGAAFALLAATNYQVGGANTSVAQWGLLAGYLGIPTSMHLISAWLAWQFPLTRKRHEVVRRRLERFEVRRTRDLAPV